MFDAPFKLGPFIVDCEGRLSPCEPGASPAFLFRWHERLVRSHLAQADDTTGRLVLETALGRVPSTASAPDESLRPRSFGLLHWLVRTMPSEWRLSLLADHRVWLAAETSIDLPITAAALVSRITCFALEIAPYLDLMDERGLPAVA